MESLKANLELRQRAWRHGKDYRDSSWRCSNQSVDKKHFTLTTSVNKLEKIRLTFKLHMFYHLIYCSPGSPSRIKKMIWIIPCATFLPAFIACNIGYVPKISPEQAMSYINLKRERGIICRCKVYCLGICWQLTFTGCFLCLQSLDSLIKQIHCISERNIQSEWLRFNGQPIGEVHFRVLIWISSKLHWCTSMEVKRKSCTLDNSSPIHRRFPNEKIITLLVRSLLMNPFSSRNLVGSKSSGLDHFAGSWFTDHWLTKMTVSLGMR